ncbi:MAG: site-2 protease family protein [Caldilineales bacterium]|nr:site-2 protease family protein [Caldilineales bacterium]MCW5858432.1 site-2 protease family protein [Caldilineales bacterium]
MSFDPITFILSIVALLLSIAIHEFSHAIVADNLGDPTPRSQGRVTLNPIAHLDPVGTMMILFSSFAGFGIGWGRPVQVNPANFRANPSAGMGIVAAAGPLSNILLALLGAILFRVVPHEGMLYTFVLIWIIVNISLAFFNLLPIFPLDGFNILIAFLVGLNQDWSRRFARFWRKQVQFGPLFLLLLVLVDSYLPSISPIQWVFQGPAAWVMNVLLG